MRFSVSKIFFPERKFTWRKTWPSASIREITSSKIGDFERYGFTVGFLMNLNPTGVLNPRLEAGALRNEIVDLQAPARILKLSLENSSLPISYNYPSTLQKKT